MKGFISVVSVIAIAILAANVQAQEVTTAASGVLRAPDNITNIVSIDAHNSVLIETQESEDAPKQYSLYVPRHIYSGAIARLFGGSIFPTQLLVSPGLAGRSGFSSPGALMPMGNNNGFNNGGFNNDSFNNGSGSGGFPAFAPQIPVNNSDQFNRVASIVDRPLPQVQIGVSQQ